MKQISLFCILCALAVLGVGLTSCAPVTSNPIDLATALTKPTEIATTVVASPEPTKTPIPPTPTATETPTPEVDYPVFDKAEDILTPEKLPVVPIEDVYSGKFAETVLRMYKEGKIHQISPAANLYPFLQWGNESTSRHGYGSPISLHMTSNEKSIFDNNKPTSFAMGQSEQFGEKVVVVGTVWTNKDGTVSVMPQTIPFSWNIQFSGDSLNDLKSIAPFPYIYNTQQECLTIKGNSREYCDYHMSVQEEWKRLVQEWVETGIMPDGLSRIPLHMISGTTIYFSE